MKPPSIADRSVQVLLVEDNAGDAKLISMLLRQRETNEFSTDVSIVSDGEAALDFLFHRGSFSVSPTPDVVILDINLPKRSGFEVLSEMKKAPELKNIPVFFLTTSRTQKDMVKAYAAGIVSFITKPANLSELEEVIRRFFSVELPRVLKGVTRI